MVYNLTYRNDSIDALIDDILGKPYSLLQKIRIGGVGSKRMLIEKASPNWSLFSKTYTDNTYCSIELRRNGILVHVHIKLKSYAWIIPYHKLSIYKTNTMSIHANGKFITLVNNTMLKANKNFFKTLFKLKTECQKNYLFHP